MRAIGALSFLLLCASALHAQEGAQGDLFTLTGQVVTSGTGEPVATAVVEIRELGRRALSDATGHFAFPGLREGRYNFVVSRPGHLTRDEAWEVRPGVSLSFPLVPQPIILEGLTVVADRLESRRKSTGHASRAFQRAEMLGTGAGNVADFLAHSGSSLVACPVRGARQAMNVGCVFMRGQTVALKVFIDEAPATGGAEDLVHLRPEDVHRVEFYQGLAMVRVYTVPFMEQLARRPRALEPVCIAC